MYLNCYEQWAYRVNYGAENKYNVKEFINSNFVSCIENSSKLFIRISCFINDRMAWIKISHKARFNYKTLKNNTNKKVAVTNHRD
jgi:hypothetical protein